ncbi:MAG TPA: DUF2130 domain-containing protein [Solirubrobacteraceae bacterium]|nr:DUF2130 domain-containing protein [Solirubrobacteraceae bacterium]
MEAATPLRNTTVRVLQDRITVDGLVVHDDCTVRLAHEREAAGDDPARFVSDAIEIGARVLDREQAGANADFVRVEFEKASREVEAAFSDRAGALGKEMAERLDEALAPDTGHLAKALERHFSDESSSAVQHRVKTLVDEVMARSREDLLRQFSSADGKNPLADFKAGTMEVLRQASDRQDQSLRALAEQLALTQRELQALRDERVKQEELEAERERGTAKGRTFEDAVHEALDRIALARGDDCEAVGDQKGATRKTGDVVVSIDAAQGPPRGRIVFEAKNSKLSKPEALRELDRGLTERDADFAVLVVPNEDKLPARMQPLREFNGDKLIVCHDPEDGSRIALEVAYSLSRARVLMGRGDGEGVDSAALHDSVERALGAMDDVRRIKSQLTGATTSIEKADGILEAMAGRVREHLHEIEELLRSGAEPERD